MERPSSEVLVNEVNIGSIAPIVGEDWTDPLDATTGGEVPSASRKTWRRGKPN